MVRGVDHGSIHGSSTRLRTRCRAPSPAAGVRWSRATSGDPRLRPDATCGTCRDIARRLGCGDDACRGRRRLRRGALDSRSTARCRRRLLLAGRDGRWTSRSPATDPDGAGRSPGGDRRGTGSVRTRCHRSPTCERVGQLWKRRGREIVQVGVQVGQGGCGASFVEQRGPLSRVEDQAGPTAHLHHLVHGRTGCVGITNGAGAFELDRRELAELRPEELHHGVGRPREDLARHAPTDERSEWHAGHGTRTRRGGLQRRRCDTMAR